MTSADVKARAREIGFDLCGVAPASDLPELQFLRTWLARRYYGTMSWLPRTARVRSDVRHIVPGARSVVVTGTLYNTDVPYSTAATDPSRAVVSRYAWGEDYHLAIVRRLDDLMAWIDRAAGVPIESRRYVDTGPVQERVYAQHAGIGWIGKNTCVINPTLGSWLFLGVIITTLPLDPDVAAEDLCGSCQLCLQACPTGALVEPHVLDARLCISYLTIEKKGTVEPSLRDGIGTRIYGCDVCQDVCPYNSRPVTSGDPAFAPRDGLREPSLARLWRTSDEALADLVEGTAMTRVSVGDLRRNLALAIGNAAGAVAASLLDDEPDPARPSLAEPAVRDAVAWARGRLVGGGSAPAPGFS